MGSGVGKLSCRKTTIMDEAAEEKVPLKKATGDPNCQQVVTDPQNNENVDTQTLSKVNEKIGTVPIVPLTEEEIQENSKKILSDVERDNQTVISFVSIKQDMMFTDILEECTMRLYRSYYALKGAPIDSVTALRKKIGAEFSKTGSVPVFCRIVMDGFEHGYRDSENNLIKIVNNPLKCCLLMLLNFSDCIVSIVEAICAVPQFLEFLASRLTLWQPSELKLTMKEYEVKLRKWMLSIIHNCGMVESSIPRLRSLDFTSVLVPFLSSTIEVTRLQAIASLADIVDEKESEVLQTNSGIIQFVMTMLEKSLKTDNRRHIGWSAKEIGRTVRRLARNDTNKKLLVTEGALPLLVELARTGDEDEQMEALLALWMLAFDGENQAKMVAGEHVVEILNHFNTSSDNGIRKASYGALWTMRYSLKKSEKYKELGGKLCGHVDNLSGETDSSHVMISYQWDNQEVLVKVRNELRSNGFRVWMDIDDMGGSTLQAMADAVEKASVILICLSQKYKDSPNCRAEAEYAFQKRKTIIPLKMQRNYEADGWLGFIVGTKLYYDFGGKYSFMSRMQNLVREMMTKLKIIQTIGGDQVDSAIQPVCSAPALAAPAAASFDHSSVSAWTSTEVLTWLDKHRLSRQKFGKLSGLEIVFLQNLRAEAPEFFYKTLTEMLEIQDLLTLATFVKAIGDLSL